MSNLKHNHNPLLRIGLFGGTFNPIHRGHLRVAEDVLQQFNLDRICLIPSGVPPHKTSGILAPITERMEMIHIALKNHSTITLSDIESERAGPSYTIDTLRELKSNHGTEAELFFMVGIDAFLEIHTWKAYMKLFDLTAFILMTRPEAAAQPLPFHLQAQAYVHQHISENYTLDGDGHAISHPTKNTIHLANVTPVAIASSQIRDMIRKDQPIDRWIDTGVSEYIVHKGLYR